MRNWQKVDYEHDWAGLIARRQTLDYGPAAASIAKNVDFFGGTIAKRLGSQYLNGWGAVVQEGSTATTIKVDSSVGFDASPADTVTVYYPSGVSESKTIATIPDATSITVSALANGAPPAGSAVIARRGLAGATHRIDGLFQANFRSGFSRLLIGANGEVFEIDTPVGLDQVAVAIGETYPATTVASNWGSGSSGTLSSTEGITVGDKIHVPAIMTGSEYYTTVTVVVHSTKTITVSPAISSSPLSGQAVVIFPRLRPSDTHFAQYGNVTHVTQDPRVETVAGIVAGALPPRVIREFAPSTLNLGRHGIKAPTHSGTAPTATINGAGVLNGVYKYRVKFRDSVTGAESEPGPVITSVALTSDEVLLSNLPVSIDPAVISSATKDIYRTNQDGDGVWFFLKTVTNATTSTTDNTPDSGLGRQMREFLDNVIPDSAVNIAVWPQANRLVAIDTATNAVIFSDQPDLENGSLKGQSWPTANSIFVNYDDGDQVIAAVPFYDSVFIFKTRSVFRVTGIPPNLEVQPIIFRQDSTGVGTFNAKAVVVDQNEMAFPALDGVYQLNRYEGDTSGFSTARLSRQLDKAWAESVNLSKARRSHGVFYRDRRQYLAFEPVGTDAECRQCFAFQFDAGLGGEPYGWSEWNFQEGADNGINITASHVAKGTPDVVYVGTSTGDVIALHVGAAERGGFPYTFEYAPVWMALAGKGAPARGRALDLVVSVDADTTLQVSAEADFRATPLGITMEIDAQAGGFFLDISQLDIDEFGPVSAERKVGIVLRALGEWQRPHFVERSAVARFRLQNFTYWFQALPTQAVRRPFLQVLP